MFAKPPAVKDVDLTKAYNTQTINLGKCNAKVQSIKEWVAKQKEIYK